MKTNNLIKACGSITKEESLVPVGCAILKNTCVAEANDPYSDYYGNVPDHAIPNSLFFFTTQHYSLAEVLRFTQNIDTCYMEKVNVATATVLFGHQKYAAIRIKYFPDYGRIHMLQNCFIKEGVEFIKKVQMTETATISVNKCFVLEEVDEGIFLDRNEADIGYIIIPNQIRNNEFADILVNIRNNTVCPLFDAAMGAIILDSKAKDMVRIYSKHLNSDLLKCIKERFKQNARMTSKVKSVSPEQEYFF